MYRDVEILKIVNDLANQKEKKLLGQLGWLVSRDLLVIEQTEPSIVQNPDGGMSVVQTVTLSVKDKEYIEKLEMKIKDLTEKLNAVLGIKKELQNA